MNLTLLIKTLCAYEGLCDDLSPFEEDYTGNVVARVDDGYSSQKNIKRVDYVDGNVVIVLEEVRFEASETGKDVLNETV